MAPQSLAGIQGYEAEIVYAPRWPFPQEGKVRRASTAQTGMHEIDIDVRQALEGRCRMTEYTTKAANYALIGDASIILGPIPWGDRRGGT